MLLPSNVKVREEGASMARKDNNSRSEAHNNRIADTKPDVRTTIADTVWSDMTNDTLTLVNSYRTMPFWTLKDQPSSREQEALPPDSPKDQNKVSFHPGDTLLNMYHIESGPFEGGMGAVWKVRHTLWDTELALKRPKPDFFLTEKQKEDFVAECKNWIGLGLHPNIVSCYYVRDIENVPSIFSEWMNNGNVEDHIKDRSLYGGTDSQVRERLLNIAIQFARGLLYAHENGLVHQDVKPDNLLVTDKWTAKISDFGLAKARAMMSTAMNATGSQDSDPSASIITPSGGKTPAYCSPEQAASLPLTKKTDIYSWAVSILEMYLGSKPWSHGRELTGPLAGIACRDYFEMCRERPIPSDLQDLLAQCLDQVPRNRPDNFAEIETRLLQIYKAETGTDYPIPSAKAAKENADSLNNHALSLLDLDQTKEAEALWRKALDKNPNHIEARYNLELWLARSNHQYDYRAVESLEAVQATRDSGVANEIRNEWGMDEPCFAPIGPDIQISFRHRKGLTAYVVENVITFMWSELHSLYSRNDYIYYYFLRADLKKGTVLKKILIDQEYDQRYHGILMLPGAMTALVLMKDGSAGIYSLLKDGFIRTNKIPALNEIASKVRDPFRIYSFACRFVNFHLFIYLKDSSENCVSGTLILDYQSLTVRKILPDHHFDHVRRDGSVFFTEKKDTVTDLYRLKEDLTLEHVHRFESGFYPIADPKDISLRTSLRLYHHKDFGVYYLDDNYEEQTLDEHAVGEIVCVDSNTHIIFLRAGAEQDNRVCLYDYNEKKILCTKEMKGGANVMAISRDRVILWKEHLDGASWQLCAFPERPVRYSTAQWKLCRVRDTETIFSDEDKLKSLYKEFMRLYKKGNRSAALSRFRACRDIPGYFNSEQLPAMESVLDGTGKKDSLYAVKDLGEQKVPDYCSIADHDMSVCGDLVLITSQYSNDVQLYSKEGESKGKIASPHPGDRCFVRGSLVYALPSGLVLDLNGKILKQVNTSEIEDHKIVDVDLSGDNVICTASDSKRTYFVKSLLTGEKRTLVSDYYGCKPVFMDDGNILMENGGDIVRVDPKNGRELQRFALSHGFHTLNESIREIITNSSRTHFAVILADSVEFDRNVTMVFDRNGLICKWQGGNHCHMFADIFLVRCMHYTSLEFIDLRDGHLIHSELSTDGRQIAAICFRWDYRELYAAKLNFLDYSFTTYRLHYDYLL